MKPDSQRIRVFHALLAKNNLMPQKENILAGEGVDSTTRLTIEQIDGLIDWLQNLGKTQDYSGLSEHQWALFNLANRQHRYLLSLCQQLGWQVWSTKYDRFVADLVHLGRWLKTHSGVKKPLMQQSRTELERTVYQFEQMVEKHFKG
jgi:hypothetical protein